MSDTKLRKRLVKLACGDPELRNELPPLVKESSKGLYGHLSDASEEYFKEIEKGLKNSGTFSKMGKVGRDGWDMWFENAEIKVEPGFEAQYPHLYGKTPEVSFIVTINLSSWSKMRVSITFHSGFENKNGVTMDYQTGVGAKRVADAIANEISGRVLIR